ncbi:MAG: phage antirepressor KilAC domain-containing protein [Treponema sp.]|nr:phage antirepressor KilAC domain-containing protein [Treponema sp.]
MNEIIIPEEKTENFVTTKELAEVLGVSARTIRETATAKGLEGTFHTLQTKGGKQSLRVFSEEEATIIKMEIQKHHNLQSRQIDTVTTAAEEDQMIAQALIILQRRIQDANKEIEKLKPAAEFAYQICSSKDAIDIGNCAKVLNRNIGRNNLFEFLRNRKVLQQDNIPYQKYIDSGYFRVIETKYTIPSGETKISLKTLVLQKGVAYINKLLREKENENKGVY